MTAPIRTGFVALGLAIALSGCTISTCTTARRLGVIPSQDYAAQAPAPAPTAAAPAAAGVAAAPAPAQAAAPQGVPSSQIFTFLPPTPHPNVNNWPGAHVGTRSGVSGGGGQ